VRILLDENLDWRLRRGLPGHEVDSVPLIGWAGMKNGKLLARAVEGGYEVFVTMDRGIPHQQNLAATPIRIARLAAVSNRLADTLPLMPVLLGALLHLKPGTETLIAA
jgi:hypothetical protein